MEVQGLNKVEICGVDTAKLPMLTAKETRELLLKVKSGDEAAREDLSAAIFGWCCPSSSGSATAAK